MINLREILFTLTKEKQQEFIVYLEKKNKRKDTKNIQLVELLLSGDLSSSEISVELYRKQNKVALHALRKRLFQSLIDFTANMSMKEENSLGIQLIKQVLSARNFLKKGQIKIGYQILDKAIIIAKEHQLFTIINEIYHTKIQYAYEIPSINIDELVLEQKKNLKQHQLEESLNIVYAKIRKVLFEVDKQKKIIDIKLLIGKSLEDENITISNDLSFKSLYQLIQITNISSSQSYDYWYTESFLLETYDIVSNHKSIKEQNFYHIEILYLIANMLFRNKKFCESFKYLEKMLFFMEANNKQYYSNFKNKYILLLAYNLNYTNNPEKAILLLENLNQKKGVDLFSEIKLTTALIVFYFQKADIKAASKLFSKFYHTDKWYIDKIGIDWLIKKNIIEILLQIDLGNVDIVDSRLLSFKRSYFDYLENINQNRVISFIKLVEIYYKNPEIVNNSSFFEKVKTSFDWIEKDKEDIFIMSFFAWLKAKMTKQEMYLVILDLVKN
ncbi:hypothetical protein BTO04_03430 [Polaribacter sp. SA4-10]|uniref:hypothetical protein n=1 Tax=Polaribacter sp. SA4-10 TaxID=754397 RepID=UPI000B3C834A|nr:hypothetical protein [Polaribacter sp. SA4-10]ARV05806.1 hypothetical protein BTO04_03430 [Polaribacter sp. SA4-10]